MDAIKTIASRLEAEWRWLDGLLSRFIYQTKLVMNGAQRSNDETEEAVSKFEEIEKKHNEEIASLRELFERKKTETTKKLFEHISSSNFKNNMARWEEEQCPQIENTWEETEKKISGAIKKRFNDEIWKFDDETGVITHTLNLLTNELNKLRNRAHGRIQSVKENLVPGTPKFDVNCKALLTWKQRFLIEAKALLRAPVKSLNDYFGLRITSAFSRKKFAENEENKEAYKNNKTKYMAKRAQKFHSQLTEDYCNSLVSKKFDEINKNIEEIKREIPAKIAADKAILENANRLNKEYAKIYPRILNKCTAINGKLSIYAIEHVFLSEVKIEHLEYNEHSSLGHGSFADVFKGKMVTEDKDVALKVCRNVLTEENASMLLQEEQKLRELDHPNVVKFYGRALQPSQNSQKFIFVMELCKGSLRDFFAKHPKCFPVNASENIKEIKQAVVQRAKDIATGLDYLHQKGIIHRDLKPENILIGGDKRMKIADVGIAKNVTDVTGTVIGTPLYMAPEVFAGKISYATADIYSFGLILWEMWYGEVVFSELGRVPVTKFSEMIANNYRPRIEETSDMLCSSYVSVIRNCCATKQQERLTADQCIAKLAGILARHTS